MQINTINKLGPPNFARNNLNNKHHQFNHNHNHLVTNCMQNLRNGNCIPQQRKAQLSKSLDLLQSQWKKYKINQDHLQSKNILFSIVKQQKQKQKHQNTLKKQSIFQSKYQHNRTFSNICSGSKQIKKQLQNQNCRKGNYKIVSSCLDFEQTKSKKWSKQKYFNSPQKNIQTRIRQKQTQTQKQPTNQNQNQRYRLSLQNKGKPSKSNINILIKNIKQLKNQMSEMKNIQRLSNQKPKLKITLHSKRNSEQPIYTQQHNYGKTNKCLVNGRIQSNTNLHKQSQQKKTQYWSKKCQIKATIKPCSLIKQKTQKQDQNKLFLKQKKFGVIQKCSSNTLKITHITKYKTKSNANADKNTTLSKQKQQKQSQIGSVLQQNNKQLKSKKQSTLKYMEIQDIIRMSYKDEFNSKEKYFSLTSRS